jgi:hypothetical protein
MPFENDDPSEQRTCAGCGEHTAWNQPVANNELCPYCGTVNWERDIDFDWENGRQRCQCELCGAEWWEVLTSPALTHG